MIFQDSDPTPVDDSEIQITVKTSAYYRWLPVKEDEIEEADVVVDSTYPGFKMRRTLISEPDTLTTVVHLPSLHGINSDRELAGLSTRPHYANLIQHLEDGPWYKMFPPGSIQSITVEGDNGEEFYEKINDHFLNEAVRNETIRHRPESFSSSPILDPTSATSDLATSDLATTMEVPS